MITVYSKDNCPGCETLKSKLKAEGKPFTEVKLGRDISVPDFLEKYPGVKSVPYMVEEKDPT